MENPSQINSLFYYFEQLLWCLSPIGHYFVTTKIAHVVFAQFFNPLAKMHQLMRGSNVLEHFK